MLDEPTNSTWPGAGGDAPSALTKRSTSAANESSSTAVLDTFCVLDDRPKCWSKNRTITSKASADCGTSIPKRKQCCSPSQTFNCASTPCLTSCEWVYTTELRPRSRVEEMSNDGGNLAITSATLTGNANGLPPLVTSKYGCSFAGCSGKASRAEAI